MEAGEEIRSDPTAEPPLKPAEGTLPPTETGWVAMSVGLLAGALACVLLWIVATHSGSDLFADTPSIIVRAAAFRLVRGDGHLTEKMFVLDKSTGGVAVVSANVTPFPARRYPRVDWILRAAQPPAGLTFVWRTRERPNQSFSEPLHWLSNGVVRLNLADVDKWSGTITGVALVVQGALESPLEIDSMELPSASAQATLRAALAQWTSFIPLKGYSVAFPFDSERADYLPLAQATATAAVLAIIAYLLFARRRGQPVDARVLWAIFAGAWLLLDARWQTNIIHQVALTAKRFAGKTVQEKELAANDTVLIELAHEIKRALPRPPARVLILCDSDLISVRVAYLLYPHNVYRNSRTIATAGHGTAPDHGTLRSGDYVALLFFGSLRYDPDQQLLRWPDGHALSAEMILAKPDQLLLRMR